MISAYKFWKAGKVKQLRLANRRKKRSVRETRPYSNKKVTIKSRFTIYLGLTTFKFIGMFSVAKTVTGIVLKED